MLVSRLCEQKQCCTPLPWSRLGWPGLLRLIPVACSTISPAAAGGMKQLQGPALRQQYPAVLDEFASPVTSNDAEMSLFRPLLARTRLEKLPLQLTYGAQQHGWSAEAFHEQCNNYGAAIVSARTEGGAVLGGYNPRGW